MNNSNYNKTGEKLHTIQLVIRNTKTIEVLVQSAILQALIEKHKLSVQMSCLEIHLELLLKNMCDCILYVPFNIFRHP